MFSEDVIIDFDNPEILEEENDIDLDFEIDIFETKTSTQCVCPKCGRHHKLKIYWTGTGTPRMYCHRCREIVGGISSSAIYESQPDSYRVNRGRGSFANENQ